MRTALRVAQGACILIACLSSTASRAQGEAAPASDEEIIVVDDEAASESSGASDDEFIIIDENGDDVPATMPPISGAIGRLWEAWHITWDSRAELSVQPVPPADGPLRPLGTLEASTWLLPAPNLSFFANAFGRAFVDMEADRAELVALADLYDAYAQVNLGVGSVQLGRLVVPYGRTQVSTLGDRVNPPDYRRGWPTFPDPAVARQPQWGAWVRTSLGAFSVDGALLVLYEPTEGSLAASDQGGLRIARYQSALTRSPARAGGLGAMSERELVVGAASFPERAILATRVRRRLGDLDLGASFVWGPDEAPQVTLPDDVGRLLAGEVLLAMGRAPPLTGDPPCPAAPTEVICFGGEGALLHTPTASLAGDVSWGLGVVVLRGEVLLVPALGVLPGKTALLASVGEGLTSTRLSHGAAALAVDGSIGEWVNGSVEVLDVVWLDVPADTNLYGVEVVQPVVTERHAVHRLALGASLSGVLLERIHWRVRGEGGVLQIDVLAAAEVQYRLPVLNLYVGAQGQVFAGQVGSPGWFRQDATSFGVFLGEGQ